MDPALEQDTTMLDFLHRLHGVGLLGFTRRAKSFVGCFFVSKKDNSQRLVIDARQTNQLHRRPPFSPLCTAGALSTVDLSGCEAVPHAVGSDFQDGFYQFRFDEMAPWFSFNYKVMAKEFGVSRVWDADTGLWAEVDGEEFLFPTFRGLVMGWSWGLYFCHSALVRALVESLVIFAGVSEEIANGQIVRERCPPPRLHQRHPLLCPYVDNANVLCYSRQEAEEFYRVMLTTLENKGFTLKDLVPPTPVMDLVGVRFDGHSRTIRNKPERVWRLIYAIREVLRMRVVPGWVLRVLNGHIINQFLIQRCALSCLSDAFSFALHNLDKWTRIPQSVVSELSVCCGVLPLISAELGSAWVPWTLCSDSSDLGYGLHASPTCTRQLADVASWKENWRFKPVSVQTEFDESDFRGICAEEWSKAPTFESWVSDQIGEGSAHRVRAPYRHRVHTLWLENPHELPDLPYELVEGGVWQRMLVGSWKYHSPIHMLEAKVALRGLHRVALNPTWHGDNSAEVLALSAGRCKNKALNGICRQAASLQLDRNPSDADSRLANAGKISGGRFFSRHVVGLDPDTRGTGLSAERPVSGCLVVSAGKRAPYLYSYRDSLAPTGNDFCRWEDLSNPVWEMRLGKHIEQARPKYLVFPWIPSGCLHGVGADAARHRRSGHAFARIVDLALACHCHIVAVSLVSKDPWSFSPIRKATTGWQTVTLHMHSSEVSGLQLKSSSSLLLSHLLAELPFGLKPEGLENLSSTFATCFSFPWHRLAPDVGFAAGRGFLCHGPPQAEEAEPHTPDGVASAAFGLGALTPDGVASAAFGLGELNPHGGPEAEAWPAKNKVSATTARRYGSLVMDFAMRTNVDPAGALPALDTALAGEIGRLYFEGAGVGAAQFLMAAVAHVRLVRLRDMATPFAKAALSGFLRLARPRSRAPVPWEAVILMADWLSRQRSPRKHQAAAAMLLQYDIYARPSEILGLTRACISPPPVGSDDRLQAWTVTLFPSDATQRCSKTGSQDDSMRVGVPSSSREWIVNILMALFEISSSSMSPLFSIGLREYELAVKEASTACGFASMGITPHGFRHGGPSTDYALGLLSLGDIQLRGAWKCRKSVLRYQKSGRLMRQLGELTPQQREHATVLAASLSESLPAKLRRQR
eukprot:6484374-Amphidinium_carterae.1